jgi:acyl transferase domain-containing protein/NADPH:quinone reductase-like Zn-dependent oxidoreductase/acyl carrier protein
MKQSDSEPLAIVGIGCRFPGAHGPEALWECLREGRDLITEMPRDRFPVDALHDARPATSGKMVTRNGGFLDNIEKFDCSFFGIAPREAAHMDPQHRFLLETALEALEDAGEVPSSLWGSRTGVFVGEIYSDFEIMQRRQKDKLNIYSLSGMARGVASGRISYTFDLRGPSLTVDTACSSSLVAVHLACQSIWQGECGMALVGGVNLMLQLDGNIGFSRAGMLAPDGRCKSFDARADGFVRSEGVGVVVLKPLSQAYADRNPIYAVIRGTGVTNDGQSSGLLMAPGVEGQAQAMREAYQFAGIEPARVQYVETHGAGTCVGDTVEVSALAAVLGENRPDDQPCWIGSVKTNIGHTEGAAGIAGLIKTALSIKKKALPPSLHVKTPNPKIPWDQISLRIQRELTPWPAKDNIAIAGVSAFGLSGTNAHVILTSAPDDMMKTDTSFAADGRAMLLPLSARSSQSLKQVAQRWRAFLVSGEQGTQSLRNLCYSASQRREHYEDRLALVAHSHLELVEALDTFLADINAPSVQHAYHATDDKHKLVFIFPGQGSQWIGMGRRLLMQEPIFRSALEQCEQAFSQYVEWSLLGLLNGISDQKRLDDIDCIQPAIFAIQIALVALWRSWGIVPDAVVGHSMGEVAAAHVAGILSLEDAAKLICGRSRIMRRISKQGGMAVIGLPMGEARLAIAGYEDRLAIAVSNSPTATVISGDSAALEVVLTTLEQREVFCRRVKVDVASHSPQVDVLRDDLYHLLAELQPRQSTIPLFSTVTNAQVDGLELDATYWVRNLREPVLFSSTIQHLLADAYDTFVEISSHPILTGAIQQCIQHFAGNGHVFSSLHGEEDERTVLLETLAGLYTLGLPIAWSVLYPVGEFIPAIPTYAWEHQHLWALSDEATAPLQSQMILRSGVQGQPVHPLLQQHIHSAIETDTYFWETRLDVRTFPYLHDHRVQESIVFPAAAYAEMALAAAVEAFPHTHPSVADLAFQKALFLQAETGQRLQLVLKRESDHSAHFQVLSLPEESAENPTIHATGTIIISGQDSGLDVIDLAQVRERCQEFTSGSEHYQAMQQRGLAYGPSFQGVQQIWGCNGEALAVLQIDSQLDSTGYIVHPAVLDACFQVLAEAFPTEQEDMAAADTYLPIHLERFVLLEPKQPLWCYARFRVDKAQTADILEGDVFLLDEQEGLIGAAYGLRFQRIDQMDRSKDTSLEDWFYELVWEPTPFADRDKASLSAMTRTQPGQWLILGDQHSKLGERLTIQLAEHGHRCIMVYEANAYERIDSQHYLVPATSLEAFQQLFSEIQRDEDTLPFRGIIHLWSLDELTNDELTSERLVQEQQRLCGSVMHLVQALTYAELAQSPRLFLVTQNAQPVEETQSILSLVPSTLCGMGRVIFYEHPELLSTLIDLSASEDTDLAQTLYQEISGNEHDEQVAWRQERRYVARLVPHKREDHASLSTSDHLEQILVDAEHPFRLEMTAPGVLDNLYLQETQRKKPGPGEVEIRVCAAGLNFHDVMVAMGIDIGQSGDQIKLGLECAGRVVTVGEGVDVLHIGDEVIAVTSFISFCLGSYVNVPATLVVPKPANLTFEEAATIPVAFLTAYYALYKRGNLKKGERVLIHAATGGVGLAAVQLAQRSQAEVFATAGTVEKRDFLHSLGVSHVMDSRSLDFAHEVLDATDGQGVDVVLNSLAGKALLKSIDTLRPYGRFLEIGKRDIYQNSQIGLLPFQRNLSFFAINLDPMLRVRHDDVRELFLEVIKLFEAGQLKPLPSTVYSFKEIATAFRYMAQGRHIGKIVISLQETQIPVKPLHLQQALFMGDASYLITGGLGGIGLVLAEWMVQHGARNLVLLGRYAPSAEAQEIIQRLQQLGARIHIARTDITQTQEVADLLATLSQTMPELRGIIHAAAILDDSILMRLNLERFMAVIAPKMLGAWNLHTLTRELPLDFFLLFSSGATLLGLPGLSNYSAGNTFLDALAHLRKAQGLVAQSINWGAWSEVGLAAAQANRGKRMSFRGIGSFTPEQGLEALQRVLAGSATQIAVMSFNVRQWQEFYPIARKAALFAHLSQIDKQNQKQEHAENQSSIRKLLLDSAVEDRLVLIEAHLGQRVAKVLGFTQTKLDNRQPLNRLGIDSLMAVELRNTIEVDFGVAVPITSFLRGINLSQLAKRILDQCAIGSASTENASSTEGNVQH